MKRVLFVDDEELVLNLIQRKMEKTDIKCYFALSAEDAIEILKRQDIDVLISDIQMPNINGLDLSKITSTISPRTVRIILSGNARVNSIIDAINESHVYKYIVKPWHIDEHAIELIQEAVNVSKKWAKEEVNRVYIDLEDMWKFKEMKDWVLLDSEGNIIKKQYVASYVKREGQTEVKIRSSIGELNLVNLDN